MIKNVWRYIVSAATNPFIGIGLLIILVVAGASYFLIDNVFMPSYVRHEAYVTVPSVKNLPIEDATLALERLDLQVETGPSRYNPQLPRDVVIDQNPKANIRVKPDRRVYLTINSGSNPESTVPAVVGISRTEAINRLSSSGLLAEEREDTIPHPYINTVTKQSPEPGKIVEEGSTVRIWYSTGKGENFVTVPDVSGLTAREAQRILLEQKLRSVVLGGSELNEVSTMSIKDQSHKVGTRIREGSEIRLFVEIEEEEEIENPQN